MSNNIFQFRQTVRQTEQTRDAKLREFRVHNIAVFGIKVKKAQILATQIYYKTEDL
jgi:hypothetical protein